MSLRVKIIQRYVFLLLITVSMTTIHCDLYSLEVGGQLSQILLIVQSYRTRTVEETRELNAERDRPSV